MLESEIEKRFVRDLKKLGCIADKFVSPGNTGVPDRVVIVPGGRVIFVELKTEENDLSKIQKYQKRRYENAGAEVRVIYGLKGVADFVNEITEYVRKGY